MTVNPQPYFVVCNSSSDQKSVVEKRQYKSCENSFCGMNDTVSQHMLKD